MQVTAWLLPHTNNPAITLAQAKVPVNSNRGTLAGLDIFPLLSAEVANVLVR